MSKQLLQTLPMSDDWIIDNHADLSEKTDVIALNVSRFSRILKSFEQVVRALSADFTVIDFGVFPGVIAEATKVGFGAKLSRYTGIGLGFSPAFEARMEGIGVQLYECDLDVPSSCLNLKREVMQESYDIAIFTDVIEHLCSPISALHLISSSLRQGGYLILTTDNISRYECLSAMLKGKSPNVPLAEGHFFYTGQWRPHFREYSKGELRQLLQWFGFEVVHHEFYQADFDQWQRNNEGQIVRRKASSMIKKIKRLLLDAGCWIRPALSDNQILIAKKAKPPSPSLATVEDYDDWIKLRRTLA